jgi:hypothetical protein
VDLYIQSSIRLHDVVLNWLSTEATLFYLSSDTVYFRYSILSVSLHEQRTKQLHRTWQVTAFDVDEALVSLCFLPSFLGFILFIHIFLSLLLSFNNSKRMSTIPEEQGPSVRRYETSVLLRTPTLDSPPFYKLGLQTLGVETRETAIFLCFILCCYQYIKNFIHSSMDLQPFVGPWPLFQFRSLIHIW